MNEREIIVGCQQGNRVAQATLVRQYSPFLMGICKRYLMTSSYEEDALQESFITIFKNINSFRNEGPFQAWMRKITVHTCLNIINTNRKLSITTIDDNTNENIPEPDMDIVEKIKAQELMQLINQLPSGYKEVFNMYVVDGYSHQEIGNMLGYAESTSRSMLTRAKSILQKTLAKNYSQVQLKAIES